MHTADESDETHETHDTHDLLRLLLSGGLGAGGSTGENPEITVAPEPPEPLLLTVRCDLVGAKPPIWRRLELRGDLTLDEVHENLQAAMGWSDSHLHRFHEPGASIYAAAYFITEYDQDIEGDTGTLEDEVRLDQVLTAEGVTMDYLYDFGDDWTHQLRVEQVQVAPEDAPSARVVKGRGACPPEDVGGIHTWNELAAALRENPDPGALREDPDLEQYADWLPADRCDPDAFDRDEIQQAIGFVGMSSAELMAQLESAGDDRPPARPVLGELLDRLLAPRAAALVALVENAWQAPAVPSPEDLTAGLRPWQAMLDEARGDGIPLTQAGWIAPAACERILERGEFEVRYGKGNREQHTLELRRLRERLNSARLLRRHKGALVLTPRGRACVDDPYVLAQHLADDFLDSLAPGARQDQVALALLHLASGEERVHQAVSLGPGSLAERVADGMAALGWIHQRGTPLMASEMSDARGLAQEIAMDSLVGRREPVSDEVVRYLTRIALWPGERRKAQGR